MHSQKYPRTYHFPFSPGTTSDDRIARSYDGLLTGPIVLPRKLDGENTCLNQYGVFARSHAAPTRNPWASYLWDTWNTLHKGLGDLELFGESLYAVHSIRYGRLESYYYLFASPGGRPLAGLGRGAVYAGVLGLPTVPVLYRGRAADLPGDDRTPAAEKLKAFILEAVAQPSSLSDPAGEVSPREGAVARVARSFTTEAFRPAYSSGCARPRPNRPALDPQLAAGKALF
jgi:hypothetical protein